MSIRWTQEEIKYLASIETLAPAIKTIARYQKYAKENGWPDRSAAAIRWRIYQRHGTSRVNEACWRLSQIAEILGVKFGRVRSWVRTQKLRTTKAGPLHIVSKKQIRAFARSHPQLLSDSDWAAIAYLLDDEKLATAIKQIPPSNQKTRAIKVYDPTSGEIYPSLYAASKDLSVSQTTVRSWARAGRLEYVSPPHIVPSQQMEKSA